MYDNFPYHIYNTYGTFDLIEMMHNCCLMVELIKFYMANILYTLICFINLCCDCYWTLQNLCVFGIKLCMFIHVWVFKRLQIFSTEDRVDP